MRTKAEHVQFLSHLSLTDYRYECWLASA